MDTIDAVSVDAERNDNLKKAKLENGFYNRRRQYQPMGFAGYTFICEGTPSVTGW